MTEALRLRAPIYLWIAERLVREISADDWTDLGREPLRSLLVRGEPSLEGDLGAPLSSESQLALEEEFARLFLLPRGVSPLASAWVAAPDKRESARQDIVDWIDRSLLVLGRQPLNQDPWGKLPLDHLAMILDLVAFAATSDDKRATELAQNLEHDLLVPALEGFGEALRLESSAPFYRALGFMIRSIPNQP